VKCTERARGGVADAAFGILQCRAQRGTDTVVHEEHADRQQRFADLDSGRWPATQDGVEFELPGIGGALDERFEHAADLIAGGRTFRIHEEQDDASRWLPSTS
jgi:hypothetical protein